MLGITLTLPALLLPSAPLRAPAAPLRAATPTMGVGRAVADAAREKYYWLAPWEKMPDPMRKFGRPTTLDLRFAIQPFNRTGAVLATVFVTQEGLAPPEPNKYEGLWNIGSLAPRTEGDLAVALATSPRTGSTLHCLLTGQFLRAVPELRGELCALSPEGTAIAWERRGHVLRVATLNGDVVRAASLADHLPPLATKPIVSSDGRFAVLGTESAAAGDAKPAGVALLEVPELRVAHVWELPGGAGVSSMTLTGDNTNLLVSGTDGSLTVLADPRLGMRLVSQMFNLGWETMV